MCPDDGKHKLQCDVNKSGNKASRTAAIDFGLGAVPIQQGRPIAFWSRKLIPAEKNYHNLLAVVEALKTFRCYVDGVHFNLITDHKPNTFLDTQPNLLNCYIMTL